jgi:hypothetical protein
MKAIKLNIVTGKCNDSAKKCTPTKSAVVFNCFLNQDEVAVSRLLTMISRFVDGG